MRRATVAHKAIGSAGRAHVYEGMIRSARLAAVLVVALASACGGGGAANPDAAGASDGAADGAFDAAIDASPGAADARADAGDCGTPTATGS